MINFLQFILFIIQSGLAFLIGYLLLLTGAAWRAAREAAREARANPLRQPLTLEGRGEKLSRFLILVPAHNEERLLPELLANLAGLDYPADLYTIHVVADNCTDQTAAIGRQAGATVHERFDSEQRGKGYALQWLLQRLWDAGTPHDAVLILDADSVVSTNFLRVMDAHLGRGERVIQAYYAVRNPDSSWGASLRYVALAALHYLRPSGRMVLGGSAGLKGNGMVFAAELLKSHPWTASITEDIEFHMALLLDGERVTFAPDAVVWAEMPDSLAAADSQNVRWERGRLEMAQRYVPPLLQRSWQAAAKGQRGRSFLLFDAVMEHLIPPFSILAAVSGLCLAAAVALPGIRRRPLLTANRLLGSSLLLGQLVYVLSGLWLAKAPRSVYRALLYAPAFVAWKIWLYLRVWLGGNPRTWVRTTRNRV